MLLEENAKIEEKREKRENVGFSFISWKLHK